MFISKEREAADPDLFYGTLWCLMSVWEKLVKRPSTKLCPSIGEFLKIDPQDSTKRHGFGFFLDSQSYGKWLWDFKSDSRKINMPGPRGMVEFGVMIMQGKMKYLIPSRTPLFIYRDHEFFPVCSLICHMKYNVCAFLLPTHSGSDKINIIDTLQIKNPRLVDGFSQI